MDGDLGSFYGFARPPFGPPTEPAQIFQADSHREFVDDVISAIFMDRAVIAVRGESGVGKTSLMRILVLRLEKNSRLTVRRIAKSASPIDVQNLLAKVAGRDDDGLLTPEQIAEVFAGRPGSRIVLLFDDADQLSSAMFHYLGLLIAVCQYGGTKLHLVMLGKPGIWEGLAHPDLNNLRQASASGDFILPLQGTEAEAYLDHKMRHAGQPLRRVMTKRAAAALCEQAHHLPARLDTLAELALQHGCRTGRKRITVRRLRQALAVDPTVEWPQDWTGRFRTPAWAAMVSGVAAASLAGAMLWHGALLDPSVAPHAAGHLPLTESSAFGKFVATAAKPDRQAAVTPGARLATPFAQSPRPPRQALVAHGEPEHPPVATSAAPGGVAPSLATLARPSAMPGDMKPVSKRAVVLAEPLPAPTAVAPVIGLPAVLPVDVSAGQVASTVKAPTLPRLDYPVGSAQPPLQQPAPDTTTTEPDRFAADSIGQATDGQGAPSLVFIARSGDNMRSLYAKVYRNQAAPSYRVVAAANRMPVQPGSLVIFPEPPGGWRANP